VSEQREYDRLGDLLDTAERYAEAFRAWGFDVIASVSGPKREDILLIVRGEVQK